MSDFTLFSSTWISTFNNYSTLLLAHPQNFYQFGTMNPYYRGYPYEFQLTTESPARAFREPISWVKIASNIASYICSKFRFLQQNSQLRAFNFI